MPTDFQPGCIQPAPTLAPAAAEAQAAAIAGQGADCLVKIGGVAPDFELPGYVQGSFKNFRLSEYLGQWVVLCFYPGDFTFV